MFLGLTDNLQVPVAKSSCKDAITFTIRLPSLNTASLLSLVGFLVICSLTNLSILKHESSFNSGYFFFGFWKGTDLFLNSSSVAQYKANSLSIAKTCSILPADL